jgi:hypothetical protein
LRQLEQHRGERLLQRLHIVQRDERTRIADRHADQAMQALVRLVLVDLEVAGGMEGDRTEPAPIGMDAHRGLLRHGATGKERRCRFAEQLADLRLQRRHGPAVAIPVEPEVGGNFREHLRGGTIAVAVQEPRARRAVLLEVVLHVGHGLNTTDLPERDSIPTRIGG